MGIGPGSWVGLMLGNVPDFVILTLALSKIDAVVVPLDPTTGNRELEMVLEAAPLRALITRPRGGEGGQAAAGLPYYATPPRGAPAGRAAVEVRARDPPAAAGDAAHVQPLQARAAREPRRRGTRRAGGRAVHRHGGRRSQGRGQDRRQPGRGRAGDRQDAGRDRTTIACCARCRCTTATASTSACWSRWRNGTTLFLEDEVSPKRIAKLLREQSIDFFAGNPALYGSLVRVPTVKPLKTARRALPELGLVAAARASPRASSERFGIRLLSCYHGTQAGPLAIDRAGKDPETVGKRVRGRRAARRRRRRAIGSPAGEIGPIWARSKTLSMLSVPKIHLPKRDDGVPIGGVDADGWFRTGDLGQHRQERPPDHHRPRGRSGQGRRQARRAGRGRGLPGGVPEGQGGAGARHHRRPRRPDGRRARRARRHVPRRGHHRPLRAQPGALQGPAPDRVLRRR